MTAPEPDPVPVLLARGPGRRAEMTDLFLGLDLGTSGCKLIAFDGAGTRSPAPLATIPSPIPGLALRARRRDRLAAGGGLLPRDRCPGPRRARAHARHLGPGRGDDAVDAAGRRSRRARSAPTCAARTTPKRSSSARRGADLRHHRPAASPLPSLPKLMWWRRNRPDLVGAAGNSSAMASSRCSGSAFLPSSTRAWRRARWPTTWPRAWSRELLAFAGIDADQLADGRRAATSSAPSARHCRPALPPRGVIVVLGGHDQPMGALGAGIVAPGTALYAIGTTEALVAVPTADPGLGRHNIPCYPHVVPGRYRCARRQPERRPRARLVSRGDGSPGDGGRARLPIDRPRGTRGRAAIVADASAAFRRQRLRAQRPCEPRCPLRPALRHGSTTCCSPYSKESPSSRRSASRRCRRGRPDRRASRGRRRNALAFWLQMKADMLGRPITRVSVDDAPCLGAAILGGLAIESHSTLEAATGDGATADSVPPRADRHAPTRSVSKYTASSTRRCGPSDLGCGPFGKRRPAVEVETDRSLRPPRAGRLEAFRCDQITQDRRETAVRPRDLVENGEVVRAGNLAEDRRQAARDAGRGIVGRLTPHERQLACADGNGQRRRGERQVVDRRVAARGRLVKAELVVDIAMPIGSRS